MKKKWIFILTAMLAAVFCGQLPEVHAATFSFEEPYVDYDVGATMEDVYMSSEWIKIFGAGNAAVQGEENRYLHVNGYFAMEYAAVLDEDVDAYSVSCDMRILENGDGVGLFLRSGYLVYKDNVAWHHMADPYMLPMHYYEWDWYAENGGKNGPSGIGSSGIVIMPELREGTNGVIRIHFKTHEADGLNVGNISYSFDSPVPVSEFFKITAEERDSVIRISVNSELLATIAFSGDDVYEDDFFHDAPADFREVYYKNAVLKDAAGNEVLSLDNARIALDGKFAFGSRKGAFDLDNFKADYIYDEAAATPENSPSDHPEATPAATPEGTASAAPVQTAGSSGKTAGPSATENGTGDGASNPYIWLLLVIAAAVLVAAVVIIIVRNRKKSGKS